jgi:hypothetical protein
MGGITAGITGHISHLILDVKIVGVVQFEYVKKLKHNKLYAIAYLKGVILRRKL